MPELGSWCRFSLVVKPWERPAVCAMVTNTRSAGGWHGTPAEPGREGSTQSPVLQPQLSICAATAWSSGPWGTGKQIIDGQLEWRGSSGCPLVVLDSKRGNQELPVHSALCKGCLVRLCSFYTNHLKKKDFWRGCILLQEWVGGDITYNNYLYDGAGRNRQKGKKRILWF